MRPYCTGELSGYPIPPTPLAAQLLERGRLPRRPLAFPPTRFSHPNRGIKSSPRIVCTQGPICGGRLRFVERCCKLATDQGGGKRRVGLATIAYSWPPLVELGGAWRNT